MKKLAYISLTLLPLIAATACGRILADSNDESGAFRYRDIYLPEYSKKANAALELDNVDADWGLWGHNLGAVLPDDPSMQVYAKVNGGNHQDQFCFTSNKLYEYICDYIDNNYMFADSMRFAILPNDNEMVCLCTECRKVGNEKGNAAPAVFNMIERLAKKYPEHEFYTSHYFTTRQLPDEPMAPNTGVLISAMEYPLTASDNSKELAFMTLINEWSDKTENVFIWDYLNNFDDYFTPSPIFGIMQRRLKVYRDSGVSGIFLNGSGNDYSVFAPLKKAVLAQLLINPDLDWQELLRKYAKEYYPVAGDDIAEFMILQEQMIENSGGVIPEYEGVEKVRATYLPEQEFANFYNKLVQHKRVAEGDEKEELETLTDAMALTMLELKRINGDMANTSKLKERLGRLKGKDIEYYNEGAWSIDEYLSNYEYMEEEAVEAGGRNLLKGVKLRPITALDEDYTDISIVTDGLLGIPSNYHNGNLIISADPQFSVGIPRRPGMKKVKVWLVYNPGFKIGLPQEVYISTNGVKSKRVEPEKPSGGTGHTYVEFDIPGGEGDVVLTLVKNPEIKTMAIDEIEAFQ